MKICDAHSFFQYLLVGETMRRIGYTTWEQEARHVLMEDQKDKSKKIILIHQNKLYPHLYQYLLCHKLHKTEHPGVGTQQTPGQETAEDTGRTTHSRVPTSQS